MIRLAAAVSALTLLVAGCSSGPNYNGEPTVFSPTPPSSPHRAPVYVGDTVELLRIGNGKIAVTVVQIINPATVSDYISDPDKTYIATVLRLRNTGSTTITG